MSELEARKSQAKMLSQIVIDSADEIKSLKQTIEAKDKEIQLYREGIEKALGEFRNRMGYEKKESYQVLKNLLSTPIAPITKDKESLEFNCPQICGKCSLLPKDCVCEKDWSDWYPYKGEVDFKKGFKVEVKYDVQREVSQYGISISQNVPWEFVEKYRIKLDGVAIYEYDKKEGAFYLGGDHKMLGINIPIGNDPHNKIIIIKE